MSSFTIGDLSQHYQTLNRTAQIKNRMHTLTQELSSGRVADVSLHLGGNAARLAHLEHRTDLIGGYRIANRETAELLTQMQLSLDHIQDLRGDLAEHIQTLPVAVSHQQQDNVAMTARFTFEAMVDDLNLRVADRSLFAGAASDRQPLADAGDMLDDLKTTVSGMTSTADVIAAVDAWFNAPAGGFETIGYLGDTGDAVSRPLGDGTHAQIALRADDSAFRETLAAVALSAVLEGNVTALDRQEIDTVLQESGNRLLSAAQPIGIAQGELGRLQSLVDSALTRQSAELTTLGILYNDMVSADPFETAASLQEIQVQLELNFALTARLSRLSMAEYI